MRAIVNLFDHKPSKTMANKYDGALFLAKSVKYVGRCLVHTLGRRSASSPRCLLRDLSRG
jgi:hypothetical protein